MSNGYKYIALQERHFSGAEYLYLSKPVCESVSDLHFFQYL